MKQKAVFLILMFVAVLSGATTAFAQNSAPPQINPALTDLSQRLGQVVTLNALDSWRFEQAIYPTTALGCDLVTNATPQPNGMSGYNFDFVFAGVAYNYRVSADNTIVVPCTAALLSIPQPTALPTQFQFDPAAVVCPAGFPGFLEPRIIVNTQARVIAGNTPNRLRVAPSSAAEQINVIQPNRTFDVIGGPSCADNLVWWQVAFDGQIGWTAEGLLPDNYFIEPLNLPTPTPGTPLGGINLTPLAPVGQPTTLPEVAAYNGDTLSMFDYANGALTRVGDAATAANIFYSALPMKWSPDGSHLVFLSPRPNTESIVLDLYSVVPGGSPVLLAEQAFYGMNFEISADGQSVLYAKDGGMGDVPALNAIPFNIFTVPIGGGASQMVGAATFGIGCGGGWPFPGDTLYHRDADYQANPVFFELTAAGLIFSSNCTGVGLSVIDLQTGEVSVLGETYGRAVLSDDGTKLAALTVEPGSVAGVLTIINLTTNEVMPLGAVGQPDQLTWGPNGDIYYTTREATGQSIPGTDSDAFAPLGFQGGLPLYEVTIHRVDLTAATDTEIFRTSGYVISRLDVSPDGSGLFFTTVPNGEAWAAEIIATGGANDFEAFFPMALSRLDLATGGSAVLAPDLWRFTLNDAAFR